MKALLRKQFSKFNELRIRYKFLVSANKETVAFRSKTKLSYLQPKRTYALRKGLTTGIIVMGNVLVWKVKNGKSRRKGPKRNNSIFIPLITSYETKWQKSLLLISAKKNSPHAIRRTEKFHFESKNAEVEFTSFRQNISILMAEFILKRFYLYYAHSHPGVCSLVRVAINHRSRIRWPADVAVGAECTGWNARILHMFIHNTFEYASQFTIPWSRFGCRWVKCSGSRAAMSFRSTQMEWKK